MNPLIFIIAIKAEAVSTLSITISILILTGRTAPAHRQALVEAGPLSWNLTALVAIWTGAIFGAICRTVASETDVETEIFLIVTVQIGVTDFTEIWLVRDTDESNISAAVADKVALIALRTFTTGHRADPPPLQALYTEAREAISSTLAGRSKGPRVWKRGCI